MDTQIPQSRTVRRRARALALTTVATLVGGLAAAVVNAAPASAVTSYDGTSVSRGLVLNNGDYIKSDAISINKFSYYFYTLTYRVTSGNGNLIEEKHTYELSSDSKSTVWKATGRLLGTGHAEFNNDGNLKIVGSKGNWYSGTGGLGITKLVLGPAGHIQLQLSTGRELWDSWDGICGKVQISLGSISSAVSAGCRNRSDVISDWDRHLIYSWGGGHGATPGASYGSISPGGYDDRDNFGFDCSGYTRYMYFRSWGGQDMAVGGNTAASQWSNGLGGTRVTSKSSLKIGDLVYFGNPVIHTGIYIGGGYILDAKDRGDNGIGMHLLSNYTGDHVFKGGLTKVFK